MNKDEIVEMTRQAGGFDATPKFLKRFAELVAQHEREACATVCDEVLTNDWEGKLICAAAIRARGQA